MTTHDSRLYWFGNIAKTRIISDILAQCTKSKEITVFDYGCGDGGDWPVILKHHPQIRLVCYEPSNTSCYRATKRLQGLNAQVLTGNDLNRLILSADYIVSLSVFEHVADRSLFLRQAKRILNNDGCFYLNYDDGHFRNFLDLSDLSTWPPAIASRLLTIISPVMHRLGISDHYQRRVLANDVDHLVCNHGFSIHRVDYHNLLSLKELAKTIPSSLQQAYSEYWLQLELVLNQRFLYQLTTKSFGDYANLSKQMLSRTLCLYHSKS